MRGTLAKAMRRVARSKTGGAPASAIDKERVYGYIRKRSFGSGQPKLAEPRNRKHRAPKPRGQEWKRNAPPIVQRPLRRFIERCLENKAKPNTMLRHMTEGLLRSINHAGQQPKWMLDRMARML